MSDDEKYNVEFDWAAPALRNVTQGSPCKIVDMSTSKTGKHGHAKVHLVGIDVRLPASMPMQTLSTDPRPRSSPAKNWFVCRMRAD